MTADNQSPANTFAYTAQMFDGQPMTGTIDAFDLDDAAKKLANMHLRIMRLDPTLRPVRPKPLTGVDFAAFNQQLAHLSGAGLPIEQGLRLIAEDLQHGGLAQSVRDVSAELERGVSLGDAFKLHQSQFPPLYGTIVEAGVRAGNLQAVLLNIGKHVELMTRLRGAIWQAVAYPITVVGGMLAILIFLGHYVLPQFKEMYGEWRIALPAITTFVLLMSEFTPLIIVLALVLFVGTPLLWVILRKLQLDRAAADLAMYIPLVGPIVRQNLIARWCDAMKLAVGAGLDLPLAVQLSGDIVGSPRLKRDCSRIITQLESGGDAGQLTEKLGVLPLPVLAVMQLSADRSDLPPSLETLAAMYQQQAEMRLAAFPSIIIPILIVFVGLLIGTIVLGLFAPMISLVQSVSG